MISRTYVIVGEAPAKDLAKKNLDVALACKAVRKRPVAGTLVWMDEHEPRLLEFALQTLHVNLIGRWPGAGPGGRGSLFPMAEAREAADRFALAASIPSSLSVEGKAFCHFGGHVFEVPKLVLLCGKRVASAFQMPASVQYFVTDPACDRVGGLPTVVVPHPSGMNLWWNDDENRVLAAGFLRDLGWIRS